MTGRRTIEPGEEHLIERALRRYDPATDRFICGGAPGFDTEFQTRAEERGFEVEVIRADWNRHGRAAGPIRNAEMLERGTDHLLAFPGGRGTGNCVSQARRLGIPVIYATEI